MLGVGDASQLANNNDDSNVDGWSSVWSQTIVGEADTFMGDITGVACCRFN